MDNDIAMYAGDLLERSASRVRRVAGRIFCDTRIPWDDISFDDRYHDWFLAHRSTEEELAEQRVAAANYSTTFSIVVPLFRTPLDLFREMVGSVTAQTYGAWELVLVNASPEDEALADAVSAAEASDSRIRVVTLDENHGIAENTNAGVAVATGDYVCFFDHDDLLEPDVLFEYAKAIAAYPDAGLLYCDEDKIDEEGRYVEPHIKPGFTIDLLRSNNYVCHLLCVRKSLLDEIGPNASRFDGAQDHALTLRVSELTDAIVHVARILYHWRITPNSTASRDAVEKNTKSYANEAGRLAIQEHLDRLGIAATAVPQRQGWAFVHEVDYEIVGRPLVSLIVATDDIDELVPFERSIAIHSKYEAIEVIPVLLPEGDEGGLARRLNEGASRASGEYLLFIDSGSRCATRFKENFIERMVGMCQRSDVGAVGGRMLADNNSVFQAGMVSCAPGLLPVSANEGIPAFQSGYGAFNVLARNYSFVSAHFMMTHRGTFEGVGGFDERFERAYFDADFCLKLREAGYLITYEPRATVRLTERATKRLRAADAPSEALVDDAALLLAKWPRFFAEGDPYFNPNLSTPRFEIDFDASNNRA